MSLVALARNPDLLCEATVEQLRGYVEEHPYDQTARLLLLENLYRLHSPLFSSELSRHAPLIVSRTRLFDMVEGDAYGIEAQPQREKTKEEAGGDRTLSLINDFLDSVPGGKAQPKASADSSQDYVAFLLQEEDSTQAGQNPKSSGKAEKASAPAVEEAPSSRDDGTDDVVDKGLYTETLAQICIKQGKYEQALKIIRQLSSNNSERNSYFADQIRFLEQVIKLNNKDGNV